MNNKLFLVNGLLVLLLGLSGCSGQIGHVTYGQQNAGLATSATGQQLFAAKCASCHVSGTAKRLDNPTALMIQGALHAVSQMNHIVLSQAQIDSLAIALDTRAPVVAVRTPVNNSSVPALVTVSGTCEDNLSVEILEETSGATARASCTGQAFTVDLTLAGADGSKSLLVTQTDLNSNKTTVALNLTKDSVAPSPTIASPASGSSVVQPAITVSGQCETGLPVTVEGTALAASISAPCSNAQYSAAVTAVGPNGAKTLIAKQTDRAGNLGSVSRSITVNFPAAAPQISIVAPLANFATRTGITLSGTCTAGLNVSISGAVNAPSQTACNAGNFQAPVNFSAGDGVKNILVRQTNSGGLAGQDSRNFVLDTTSPVVAITAPAAATRAAAGVSLSGTCDSAFNVVIAGSGAAASQTMACTNGLFQSMVNFSAGLGIKTITVSQTDAVGNVGTASRNFERFDPAADLNRAAAFGKAGLRRLTRYELVNTLNLALTVDPTSLLGTIPDDLGVTTYFDNEQGPQAIAASVIESYESFSRAYSVSVASSDARIAALGGCTPVAVNDRACFVRFAQKIGRRLLRRVISTTEANHYADILLPYAVTDNRFGSAIGLTLSAWLQHPEFLYRVETGPLSNGLISLNNFQIATRMSFTLWGSGPDDALLDAAQAGQLLNENNRVAQAQRMLADVRAKRQIERFHREWLGFDRLKLHPSLDSDMRGETGKLIERVVFELNRDWMDLFNWEETYVTPALANHYAFTPVANPTWVRYAGLRGGGILSHASIAGLGAKFSDTSPTLRGYELFKRLNCGKLPGAIPAGVDTDNPPGMPGQCKPVNYNMRSLTACQGCHNITDNIGFGLENINTVGQWRDTEPGLPQCTITGQGSFNGAGFQGPRALGNLLTADPALGACATRQLFRFMSGRLESTADEVTLQALSAQYQQSRTLSSILLALVKSPAIMYKGAP